jgi:hypothetical protein
MSAHLSFRVRRVASCGAWEAQAARHDEGQQPEHRHGTPLRPHSSCYNS